MYRGLTVGFLQFMAFRGRKYYGNTVQTSRTYPRTPDPNVYNTHMQRNQLKVA